MKTTTTQYIQSVRSLLTKRYPNYAQMPTGERVLLAMSTLALDFRVKESGTNRGPWVEAILDCAGLGRGFPWCAAAINFACEVACAAIGPKKGEAAVISWYRWAKTNQRLRVQPRRGSLALWLNPDGSGHIGIVAGVTHRWITTYEGNTTSVELGSQRDGDGLYRRRRPRKTWEHFIELN
ncbi:MAG: CHAP domain-containing protein [Fimbriimonadaceae bacterium]